MADFKYQDLISLLEDADLVYHENASHIILKECPNCGGEDKLFVSKNNLLWQCFKCKDVGNPEFGKGNLYLFLQNILSYDKNQIKSIIFDHKVIQYAPEVLSIPQAKEQTTSIEHKDLVQYELPSYFYKLDCSEESLRKFPEAYQYLFSRKVNSRTQINKFDLRYNPAQKRIIFPAYTEPGFCVGVQARDITLRYKQNHPKCQNFKCSLFRKYYFKGEQTAPIKCPECNGDIVDSFYPKATNSKNFPKTEFFFNQQNIDWNLPVILVEGPFDTISTPNSLGLLGRTLSSNQFNSLVKNIGRTGKLILFLDGDEAGTFSTLDVYNKLYPFMDIRICPLYNQDDPGSHSLQDNIRLLNDTVSPQEWAINKNILL